MASAFDLGAEIQDSDGERPGATTTFPYDRLTVERFRKAFPRARWRDDLRAWFVPGTTAGRRLDRWLGRELSSVLAYADEKGRDAFAFDPLESAYLEVADDLRIKTPYSRTVIAELREVPWAWWDSDIKAWRVPFRSLEELRGRWPTIEAAARRNEPEERLRRRDARKGSQGQKEGLARASERRRRRYPVPCSALPPLGRVVVTSQYGPAIFTDVSGELVDETTRAAFYPDASSGNDPFVWGSWRKATHGELVKAWPARMAATVAERERGWWPPTLEELRDARRKAASIERTQATRHAKRRMS